jgi:hypothetical protein
MDQMFKQNNFHNAPFGGSAVPGRMADSHCSLPA